MKPNKVFFIRLIIIAFILSVNVCAKSQNCTNNYNNALGYYQKGQYETVVNYLSDCLNDFINNKAAYLNNSDIVFKVYKLIINSYRNIDKDNLANQKFEELKSYYNNLTPQQVQTQFDNTRLDPI